MELVIRIDNEKKAVHFLNLLEDLSFVKVEKITTEKTGRKKRASKPENLKKLFGIWAEEEISLKDIRKKAYTSFRSISTGK